MAKDIHVKRLKDFKIYAGKPLADSRDNKSVRVGSGGSNKNQIRYPSKREINVHGGIFTSYSLI